MRAAAAPGTTATVRISAAVPATTAADVVMGTAARAKAVATTVAALREHSQLLPGERRSSVRASVLDQMRNSVANYTQKSLE
jgi:hypothetical protein